MIGLFYVFLIVFIWNEMFYIKNMEYLDMKFKDRKENKPIDLLYYLTRVLYYIWIIIGLFSYYSYQFQILLSLGISKKLISFININFYNKHYSKITKISSIISIIIMIFILFERSL
jgi:hypothetical protein